jgi:hypothetical protein
MYAMTLEALRMLCAELRAIDFWNASYWRISKPKKYEKIAFQQRKKRRREIIEQILVVTRRIEQKRCLRGQPPFSSKGKNTTAMNPKGL